SKLLESNGWVGLHPMAFMCIPIRSAVFLGGLGCALQGFLLLQHADLISVRRLFVGGYNDWSCALMDLLDVSAGVWGLIGALGAFYMREGFLRTFYYYEALRLMCWFLMYFLDVPLLLNCELGRDDPNAFVERFGAHQAVLKIAAEGQCDEERSFFYVLSFACLAFFSQFFFATQRLLLDFSDDPRYLLLSKEGPTGIFQQQVGSGVPTAATPLVFSGVNAPEGSPRRERSGGMTRSDARKSKRGWLSVMVFGAPREPRLSRTGVRRSEKASNEKDADPRSARAEEVRTAVDDERGDRDQWTLGISDSSSRLSLKKAMEQFGEVVGCHMGARGVDNPIVRYKTQEFAQTALDALKKGEVWLDGMILKGEWKNSGRPPPPEGKSGGKGGGRSEGGLDLTSRDIFTSQRSRSRRRRSRSRRRRRSPSRSRSRSRRRR
ncbi:Hypothetical protein SCF082_LOCUS24349, partial [Durusdinium trenchii]